MDYVGFSYLPLEIREEIWEALVLLATWKNDLGPYACVVRYCRKNPVTPPRLEILATWDVSVPARVRQAWHNVSLERLVGRVQIDVKRLDPLDFSSPLDVLRSLTLRERVISPTIECHLIWERKNQYSWAS